MVSKLEKLEYYTGTFKPTERDVKKWFRILNDEIFDSVFETIPAIDIRIRRGAHAYFESYVQTKEPEYIYPKLCINKCYSSKKQFVEILGHEMIHYHQAIHGNPLGHGPSFHAWKETFNKKGLRLLGFGYDE